MKSSTTSPADLCTSGVDRQKFMLYREVSDLLVLLQYIQHFRKICYSRGNKVSDVDSFFVLYVGAEDSQRERTVARRCFVTINLSPAAPSGCSVAVQYCVHGQIWVRSLSGYWYKRKYDFPYCFFCFSRNRFDPLIFNRFFCLLRNKAIEDTCNGSISLTLATLIDLNTLYNNIK